MDLIKIKLRELQAFCKGDLFRTLTEKPLSPLRMESYLNNPRANMDDFVLYMFIENEILVAFRTILPDYIVLHGEKITFGWCSGTYVNPSYRGQKISVSLLLEVLKDWNKRLMFTNYAEASEYCNLSTRQFKILKARNGSRFYFYPNFNQLYRYRKHYNRIKWVLPLLSFSACTLSFLKSSVCMAFKNKNNYVELSDLDWECENRLRIFPDTFFNRKKQELNWMIRYPWITQSTQDNLIYPFSYLKKNYMMRVVKFFDKNVFAGFFIYTVIDSKMKVIYHFVNENKFDLMINTVSALAKKNRIEYLTILDPVMACLFKKRNKCFAFSKSYTSHIYTSLDALNENDGIIFDGDGDNGFT